MCCQIGNVIKMVWVPANKPLTVYRQFRVSPNGSLNPLAFSYKYKPGTNKTTIPHLHGENGFWSYHTKGTLVRRWGTGVVFTWLPPTNGSFSDARINVRVKVWGRVALHKLGVRAQYMAIAPRVFVRTKDALRTAKLITSKRRSALITTKLPTFS